MRARGSSGPGPQAGSWRNPAARERARPPARPGEVDQRHGGRARASSATHHPRVGAPLPVERQVLAPHLRVAADSACSNHRVAARSGSPSPLMHRHPSSRSSADIHWSGSNPPTSSHARRGDKKERAYRPRHSSAAVGVPASPNRHTLGEAAGAESRSRGSGRAWPRPSGRPRPSAASSRPAAEPGAITPAPGRIRRQPAAARAHPEAHSMSAFDICEPFGCRRAATRLIARRSQGFRGRHQLDPWMTVATIPGEPSV